MAVKWFNDDQVMDVVAVVIDSVATTVEMMLHGGGGVYVVVGCWCVSGYSNSVQWYGGGVYMVVGC